MKEFLQKVLEHTGSKGQIKLTIVEGDLTNLESRLYQIYISRENMEGNDLPVYSDQNNNIKFDIEVLDQTNLKPVETQTANVSFSIYASNKYKYRGFI